MPNKKSIEEHLKYPGIGQDSIFGLRKVKEFLEPAMDEMLNNLHRQRLEESELSSLSCDKSGTDQIRSVCVKLSPC